MFDIGVSGFPFMLFTGTMRAPVFCELCWITLTPVGCSSFGGSFFPSENTGMRLTIFFTEGWMLLMRGFVVVGVIWKPGVEVATVFDTRGDTSRLTIFVPGITGTTPC